MEENYNATSRNGHESQDMYDPKKSTNLEDKFQVMTM